MDIRFGAIPASSARIALTSLEPDRHPTGSQAGSWSFDNPTSHENHRKTGGFTAIGDGGGEAGPSDSDAYLTAAYEQYDRGGQVERARVHTFRLDRTEGASLDLRV